MRRLEIAIACWLCVACSAAHSEPLPPVKPDRPETNELAVRKAIGAQVAAAFATGDYAALNGIGQHFLASRERTPHGWWKLSIFYNYVRYELGDGLTAKDGCQFRKAAVVRRWRDATPRSPVPYIAEAGLLYDQAWCWRGAGFSSTVDAQVWPRFDAQIAAANQILEQYRFAAADPQYYAEKVRIQRSIDNDPSLIMAIVTAGTERTPSYYPIYENAVYSFLPQWGGSWAAMDRFARFAAARAAATEKSGFYARVYTTLDECGCLKPDKIPDWPMMRQGLRDIYTQNPVERIGDQNGTMACDVGDIEEGKAYLRALHPEAPDDRALAAMFATCEGLAQHRFG